MERNTCLDENWTDGDFETSVSKESNELEKDNLKSSPQLTKELGPNEIKEMYYIDKQWPTPAYFCSFLFFSNTFLQKNCRRQQDSNSDCRIRRRARWPFDHCHGPYAICLLIWVENLSCRKCYRAIKTKVIKVMQLYLNQFLWFK